MKSQQLDLFSLSEEIKVAEDIYYNAMGEPLPWEDPEYIRLHA